MLLYFQCLTKKKLGLGFTLTVEVMYSTTLGAALGALQRQSYFDYGVQGNYYAVSVLETSVTHLLRLRRMMKFLGFKSRPI